MVLGVADDQVGILVPQVGGVDGLERVGHRRFGGGVVDVGGDHVLDPDRPDLDDAVVRLAGPVRIEDVIAAYVDNAAAEPAVAKAIEAVDAADLGDEDADLIVGDAQDHDLAWYASQELPFLLELL